MKSLLIIMCLSTAINVNAKQIVLDNQQSLYKLQTAMDVTHTEYREEEQEDTCSRVVQTGSHQECTHIPGDQICRSVGGGEDCYDVPGERICQTVGGGQQCHMVDGGQSCGLTPSGHQCFDLPDREECTTLPSHEDCYTGPSRRECTTLPSHDECTQGPGHQQCRDVADYETEYYTCTKLVTVPYQVKDGEIINDVTVQVELNQKLPKDIHEVIDFVQALTALDVSSISSTGKVLVYATPKQTMVSDNGFLKKLETVVKIKLLDRAVAYGAFLIPASIVKADSGGMMVTTGLISDPKTVSFELKVSTKKGTIFDRALLESEISFAHSATQSAEKIDFAALGISDKLAGKKVHIELKIQSNVSMENLINTQNIPAGIGKKIELDIAM